MNALSNPSSGDPDSRHNAGAAEPQSNYPGLHTEEIRRLQESALASTTSGILIADARLPDFPLIYISAAFERLTGYTAEEVIGRNCRFLQLGDRNQPAIAQMRTFLQTGQPCQVVLRNYRKDGTLFWNELSLAPVYDEENTLTHYVGIMSDVTERVRMEQALRESEARYRLLAENTRDLICLHEREGTFLYVSPAVTAMLGYAPEELIGKDCYAYFHPDDRARIRSESHEHALAGEVSNRIEYRCLHKAGHYLWLETLTQPVLDTQGQVIHLQTATRDISERKAAESALHEQERRLREMLENVNLIAVMVDGEGNITFCNDYLLELTSWQREAVYGRNWFELFLPEDERAETRAVYEQATKTGSLITHHVTDIVTRHGVRRTIAWNNTLLRDPQGRVAGAASLGADVTERNWAEQALLESEAQNRAILDTVAEGIITIDDLGRVETFNAAAASCFGYAPAEFIGRSIGFLIPELDVDRKKNALVRWLDRGRSSRDREEPDIWGVHKAGRRFPLELSISAAQVGERTFYTGIVRDLTERLNTRDQIRRQVARLTALHDIDMTIAASLDLRLTLQLVLDQAVSLLNVDAADVLLYNPRLNLLECVAGRGFRDESYRKAVLRLGEGYAGRVALERMVCFVPSLADDERSSPRLEKFADEQFVSYYGVPLVAKGQVQGVLEVFQRKRLAPDADWCSFLEMLAGQAAIAIDNATLFDDLQRTNLELTLAYDTTLEGWARALDLRDHETEGHTRRVTEMTMRLAREMGVGDADLVHIRRGALLHDIGKMGIPDSILLKPGTLSEEEWQIMRRHPDYAREMLAPIGFLRPALDIPYCHHEKWDGTGYPRGLKGEEIPLAARIFAVVDVVDALCSDRPYRAGWPLPKVREHLRALAGTHLQPEIVAAFLNMKL